MCDVWNEILLLIFCFWSIGWIVEAAPAVLKVTVLMGSIGQRGVLVGKSSEDDPQSLVRGQSIVSSICIDRRRIYVFSDLSRDVVLDSTKWLPRGGYISDTAMSSL